MNVGTAGSVVHDRRPLPAEDPHQREERGHIPPPRVAPQPGHQYRLDPQRLGEVVQRGDVIGGQTFLAKPVSVADMLKTIEKFAA